MRESLGGCILFVLALSVISCAPMNPSSVQSPAPAPSPEASITVLVLDGTNGRPVFRESPNIWVDDEDRVNPKTNLLGKTNIKVSSTANHIMISPNWGHECRGGDNPQAITHVSYSIAEIRQTGVVTLNLCGKYTKTPEPGVLIFYERPSTWKELWND